MIILIMGVLITLGLFLYKNFYQTITQSEEIILLKQEVAPDTINMKKVEAILKALEEKTTTTNIIWQEIKNPFTTIQFTQPQPSQPTGIPSSE